MALIDDDDDDDDDEDDEDDESEDEDEAVDGDTRWISSNASTARCARVNRSLASIARCLASAIPRVLFEVNQSVQFCFRVKPSMVDAT